MNLTLNLSLFHVDGGFSNYMFELKIIRHSDISLSELDSVISIKSTAWSYTYEKQLDWIEKNLTKTDLHLMLLSSNNIIGYLNIINIEVTINFINFQIYGIGNVCVRDKGVGIGQELMKQANEYITNTKKNGLLFCKPQLINFYSKAGWILVEKNRVNIKSIPLNTDQLQVMILNYWQPVLNLTYIGKLF